MELSVDEKVINNFYNITKSTYLCRCFLLPTFREEISKWQKENLKIGLSLTAYFLSEGGQNDGLTKEQIAENIGISRSTLAVWENRFQDIADALKVCKAVPDRHVENQLYKRAVGYKYTEVIKERDKITGEMVTTKEIEKEVAPDVTAQIYWLKNRVPERWRDQRETVLTGKDGKAIQVEKIPSVDLSKLSKEELMALTREAV